MYYTKFFKLSDYYDNRKTRTRHKQSPRAHGLDGPSRSPQRFDSSYFNHYIRYLLALQDYVLRAYTTVFLPTFSPRPLLLPWFLFSHPPPLPVPLSDLQEQRLGAVEARWAHNPKDPRSKRGAASVSFFFQP